MVDPKKDEVECLEPGIRPHSSLCYVAPGTSRMQAERTASTRRMKRQSRETSKGWPAGKASTAETRV